MRRSIRARLCWLVIPLSVLFTVSAWAVYQGLGHLLAGPLIPGCASLGLPGVFCQWQASMMPWLALAGALMALLWFVALASLMIFRSAVRHVQHNVLGYQMGHVKEIADGVPREMLSLAQQLNRIMNANRTAPFANTPPEPSNARPTARMPATPEAEPSSPAPQKERSASPMAIRETTARPTSASHPARQCREVTEVMKQRYPHISYELTTDIADHQEWPAAETELADLYGQLLDNAGGRAHSQVSVFLAIKGNVLIFAVTDDGAGLPGESANNPKKGLWREHEGAEQALGLEAVSKLVDRHGGFITFDSNQQGGLEVIATLPATPARATQPKTMTSRH